MRYFVLFFVLISFVYGDGYYAKKLRNCDSMYSDYKYQYTKVENYKKYEFDDKNHPCTQVDNLNSYEKDFVYEKIDEKQSLEVKSKTLGVACYQAKLGLKMFYKTDYCSRHVYTQIPQIEQNQIYKSQQVENIQQTSVQQVAPKQDFAKIYKNAPQLKFIDLHIYDIKNLSFFRNQKDVIFVESSSGNYAIPKEKFTKAERINLTSQLEQEINKLLEN